MSSSLHGSAAASETSTVVRPSGEDSVRWFKDEVHAHDARLKSWLKETFPAVRDVDDVVQESYLRIWRARATHPIQSAKAFLFQIARRLALDTLRKNRRSPLEEGRDFAASGVLDNRPNAAEALITNETLDHLADAIAALPPRWRQVLVMHKLNGLSQKEVAEQLGLSERTIEKFCRKGLRRCESHLESLGIRGFFR